MTEIKPENLVPEQCAGWRIAGIMYPILEEAQKAAIRALIYPPGAKEGVDDVPKAIVSHRTEVLAILSLAAPKQRKARADRGTKRTKKIAPVTSKPVPSPAPDADPNKMDALPKYKNK